MRGEKTEGGDSLTDTMGVGTPRRHVFWDGSQEDPER